MENNAKIKQSGWGCVRVIERPMQAAPTYHLNTHPPACPKKHYWLMDYAGGLKLDLSYTQYGGRISVGLTQVNFNGGILYTSVKSKR